MYCCYVVFNCGLAHMTKGRVAAQSHHAATQMEKWADPEILAKWKRGGDFGYTICLRADVEQFEWLAQQYSLEGVSSRVVIDESYKIGDDKYIEAPTAIWYVGPRKRIKKFLKGLKLL